MASTFTFRTTTSGPGPFIDFTYFLAPPQNAPSVTLYEANDEVELEEGDGEFVTAGTGPEFTPKAEWTATILVGGSWLTNNLNANYGNTFSGMESALAQMFQCLKNGGMGTFKETFTSPVSLILGGSCASRSCRARLGQYTVRRQTNAPVAEVDVTIQVFSSEWLWSDGTPTPFF